MGLLIIFFSDWFAAAAIIIIISVSFSSSSSSLLLLLLLLLLLRSQLSTHTNGKEEKRNKSIIKEKQRKRYRQFSSSYQETKLSALRAVVWLSSFFLSWFTIRNEWEAQDEEQITDNYNNNNSTTTDGRQQITNKNQTKKVERTDFAEGFDDLTTRSTFSEHITTRSRPKSSSIVPKARTFMHTHTHTHTTTTINWLRV